VVKLYFDCARLSDGWARDVTVDVGADGRIAAVSADSAPAGARRIGGACVPGMANLHSHAFQWAFAGLAEVAGPVGDSFWSWRRRMYDFVARFDPDMLQAVAARLYVEMLKAGYTGVGEFHYLHHGPDGGAYDDPAEMSERIVAAARTAGIGLTLLPVLYAHGGFGRAAPADAQRRFVHDADGYLLLIDTLTKRHGSDANTRIGIAPHSLRAVTPELLTTVLDRTRTIVPESPIHIHIAEQRKEVEDCLAWSGQRPVAWLLEHMPVDRHWCLVHATHLEETEQAALADSAAVAGLCPTTEANLGDGIFPAVAQLQAGGRIGIGSDSHVCIDPAEELRLLEYGQRLTHGGRNLLAGGEGRSTGARLYAAAARGGAQALGFETGVIAPDQRADLVVLDPAAVGPAPRSGDALLDGWIFSGPHRPVRHVFVAGRQVVSDGRHAEDDNTLMDCHAALARLSDV